MDFPTCRHKQIWMSYIEKKPEENIVPNAVLSFHDEYFSFHYFLFRPAESYFKELNEINARIKELEK